MRTTGHEPVMATATPTSETPPSDETKQVAELILTVDPALQREDRKREAVEIGSGELDPDRFNQATEEAHTAQVEGLRVQLRRFRKEYEDRVREEAVAGGAVSGHPSRVILGQVTSTARKLAAAERARARFREWRRTVDNIDSLKATLDSTEPVPRLPWLRAFEAYTAARVEAGMATKGQLRMIREQIADLE
jgi:hypothetical protein